MQLKYIATTAQSEFWSKSDPVLLLGSWCRPGFEKFKPLEYAELPCIWETDYTVEEAEGYCWNIFRRLIPKLCTSLNRLHGVNRSERYWEVLLSDWFLHFVNVLYDRYLLAKSAVRTAKNAWTTVVPREIYSIPPTGSAAIRSYCSYDWQNLQLFSEVFRFLRLSVVESAELVRQVNRESKKEEKKGRQTLWHFLRRLQATLPDKAFNATTHLFQVWRLLASRNSNHLLFYANYHFKHRADLLILSMLSGVTIYIPRSNNHFAQRHDPLLEVRDQISNDLSGHGPMDEFEALVLYSAPYFVPVCFVEGYNQLVLGSLQMFGQKPRDLVFDAPTLRADGFFEEYVARCAESGKLLVSMQHGGHGYGHASSSPVERIEIELYDRFISFGWKDDRFPEKIIPLPSPHLSSLKRVPQPGDSILHITSLGKTYLHRLVTMPFATQWDSHLDDCETFLKSLPSDKLLKVRFRPSPSWIYTIYRVPPLIESLIKGQQCENRFASQALSDCRMAVIDHPITGWLEALASNTPTILFWNPNRWRFRAAARPYLDELHKEGILHYDPISAARKVEEVYDHVDQWWHQADIQRVRVAFCECYAWATPHWRQHWIAALRNLATLPLQRDCNKET